MRARKEKRANVCLSNCDISDSSVVDMYESVPTRWPTHRQAASSARVMADVDSEMHDAAAGGAGSAELHQRTIRVLVVEDDPFSVTVLQHLFAKITQGAESFGLPPLAFEVTEAGTAEAATR